MVQDQVRRYRPIITKPHFDFQTFVPDVADGAGDGVIHIQYPSKDGGKLVSMK